MEQRVFILGTIIILSLNVANCQNLVLNPNFDEIVNHNMVLDTYLDTFYAKSWFSPTGGSVDIYRSNLLPEIANFNLSVHKPFTTNVVSGNYCIGLFFIDFMGDMEHITGKLRQPLESEKSYEVSFYIRRYPSKTPFLPKGMGYKFSKDSIVFKTNEFDSRNKYSAFYDHLFKSNKVFSDFEIDNYIMDTTWTKYTSIYKASGEEKYITLGRFAYENDKNIIKHFKKVRHNPFKEKILKFLKSDKSKVCKRFFDKKEEFDIEGSNYYYIDMIEVIPLDDNVEKDEVPIPTKNAGNKINRSSSPIKKEIKVDRGFEGNLKLELRALLGPGEKYGLEYGKKCELIIINTSEESHGEMKYLFEHPARKLKKRPVRYYIEKTNAQEIETLKSQADEISILKDTNFQGILIKKKRSKYNRKK